MPGNLNTLWESAIPIENVPSYPTWEYLRAKGGEDTFRLNDNGLLEDRKAKEGEILFDTDMRYKDDVSKNLIHRIEARKRTDASDRAKEMEYIFCKSSVLYFINTWVWTYDPRKESSPHIPMVTYPFQDDVITWQLWLIQRKETGIIEKSRDMGASWMAVAVTAWLQLFHEGVTEYYMSMTEKEVDDRTENSLLGKLRYVYVNLPVWMRQGFEIRKHGIDNKMAITLPGTKSLVMGQLTMGTGGRGGRARRVVNDEFAFVGDADNALKAIGELSPSGLFLSTSNGMGNTFYRMASQLNVEKKSLHWKKHPLKNPLWAKRVRSKPIYTDEIWNMEHEIDYQGSTQGRVYPEFISFAASDFDWMHVQDSTYFDYDPNYDVYVGIDFGMADATSIVFAQIKPPPLHFLGVTKKCLIIFREEEASNKTVDYWANFLLGTGYVYRDIVGDYRSGNQRDPTGNTWIKYLDKYKLNVKGRTNTEMAPIMEVKKLLQAPGCFAINKHNCPNVIKAFQNWSYDLDRETGSIRSGAKPKHNEWSHSMKAVAYMVDWIYGDQKSFRKDKRAVRWDFAVI